MSRNRLFQWVWILLAVVFLVAAGLFQGVVDETSTAADLNPPENVVAENQPGLAFLNVMPGGLRAPVVNYLWIRANDLKEEGRYYDAYQLSSLICHLQPRSPGVWYFHAWNMAWNIATAVHTPERRWHWVSNGMALLRDEAIPINPDSIYLYKELSWIFMSKIGGDTDEMHRALKRRWAAEMHKVFGSPPVGSTQDVIDWFRGIAEAPLDRDPSRPRKEGRFQEDVLVEKILDADPKAAEYVSKLRATGLEVDASLLEAWHRFSLDEEVLRAWGPRNRRAPRNEAEASIAEWINSDAYALQRKRLLDWVRSQILWNKYKMDPRFMLGLMEKHNVPLDWRLPWPHGMYWAAIGLEKSDVPDITQATPLNTNRIELSCMKQMTAFGRLRYMVNPDDPDNPQVDRAYDPRYIPATHRQFVKLVKEFQRVVLETQGKEVPMSETQFSAAHLGYLRDVMLMLVIADRQEEANEYFQWIKDNYKYDDDAWWKVDTALEHVRLWLENDSFLTTAQARTALGVAFARGFAALAASGQGRAEYNRVKAAYIDPIYNAFQSLMPERTQVRTLDYIAADVLYQMMTYPRALRYDLSLEARSRLWAEASSFLMVRPASGDGSGFPLAVMVYDAVADPLRRQCRKQNLDFEKMFPRPRIPGPEEGEQ